MRKLYLRRIGLPEERTRPLNANHREICKFGKRTGSNYVTVRNALISTINPILIERNSLHHEKNRRDMKLLGAFLGIPEKPEDDLKPDEDRADGTCEWLIEKSTFDQWMREDEHIPKLFWLNGNPGSGKSVLTSYVIRYLEKCNKECSYFLFCHNDKSRSSTSVLLRSIAYQMALTNVNVRKALLKLCEEGEMKVEQTDERTLWRKIFMSLIFKVNFDQVHFWIIDALDECQNCAALVPLLAKIDEKIPLRIFISSRNTSQLDKLFHSISHPLTIEPMSLQQTQADIRLYIEANVYNLPVEDDIARQELTETILDKANDCFLWAYCVLRELEQTFSEQQIKDVLNEVPKEMGPLYSRMLEGMSKNTRNRELIRGVLAWTVCATRPLELVELRDALVLDIDMTIPRLDRLIESSCGEMIYVDKQSKVQLIHPTAREFLLDQSSDPLFAIERGEGHARLAAACLRYLASDEQNTPRHRRKSSSTRNPKMSYFEAYASTAFSTHVKRSSLSNDLPLMLLDEFFNANVLTWIEGLASKNNLQHVLQTARDLKAFLQRRAEERSPLGKEFQNVQLWTVDLIRVVMAFGNHLIDFPFAIHFLIPPVCPPQSRIFSQFGSDTKGLEVVRPSTRDWHDRLSCITHRDDFCSAIACLDTRFAIGLSSGAVVLYSASTCREIRRLEHGERVHRLQLASINTLLAAGGRRHISLWNSANGDQLWVTDVPSMPLSLWFYEDETTLATATKANKIIFWSVSEGKVEATYPWHDKAKPQSANSSALEHQRTPTLVECSVELNVIAIAYRSKPLVIWDLEERSLIGTFDRRATPKLEAAATKPGSSTWVPSAAALGLAFNPDPHTRLLAIAYQDGDLAVIDPMDQVLKAPIVVADASVIAASPDGKTLVTGDAAGTIKLFNFETLELFYQISCIGYDIKALTFSTDGLRFFDIRGPHCNVWEPAVLVRKSTDDSTDNSQTGALLGPVQTIEAPGWMEKKSITAVTVHHTGDYLFCAKEDGSVCAYETDTGNVVQHLFRHAEHIAVCLLVWNAKKNLLASADLSGRFMVRRIIIGHSSDWQIDEPLIDRRSDHSIYQILLRPNGDRVLLSTSAYDYLWDSSGESVAVYQPTTSEHRNWITHPKNPDWLLLLGESNARIFHWDSLEELDPINSISLRTELSSDFILGKARVIDRSSLIVLEHLKVDRISVARHITLWNADEMHPKATEVRHNALYSRVASEILSVVGIYGSSLVFLNHLHWFCTLDLEDSEDDSYVRHFFIPAEWYSSSIQLICCVTVKGDVAIIQDEDIIVVKNGLSLQNTVYLE